MRTPTAQRESRDRESRTGRTAFRIVSQVITWSVLLIAIVLLSVMVLVPRVTGATPYTVLTGSMEPSYPPGTLVVSKPVDATDLGIGTPVTYQLESGEAPVVTHRVVEVRQGADGETRFVTKGDANDVVDQKPVRPVQIRGAVWYSVPYLGYLNSVFTGDQHQLIVLVVAAGLLLYAGYMFVSAVVGRRRVRRRGAGAETQRDTTNEREEIHV